MAEYIEREALLEEAESRIMWGQSAIAVYEAIREAPAADVAPVRPGRWIYVDTDKEEFFVCNRCKKKEYWESSYCPNCGAKMDGGMTDCTRHECSECDIKEAFRHLGPFGLLFIGYKGDPRGPIGRAGNKTLPEEALVMGTLVDVDGNRWVPVNEEVLLELISEYKKSEGGPQ